MCSVVYKIAEGREFNSPSLHLKMIKMNVEKNFGDLVMPYKDKEQNREYQRKWAEKKRHGLDTKIVRPPQVSEEDKKERKKIISKKVREKRAKGRNDEIGKIFGKNCFLCQAVERLFVHRKDGFPHKRYQMLSNDDFKSLLTIENELYIRICQNCHNGVHWLMRTFKFDWEKITRILGT